MTLEEKANKVESSNSASKVEADSIPALTQGIGKGGESTADTRREDSDAGKDAEVKDGEKQDDAKDAIDDQEADVSKDDSAIQSQG